MRQREKLLLACDVIYMWTMKNVCNSSSTCKTVLSSSDLQIPVSVTDDKKSLTKMFNKIGSSTAPCETANKISKNSAIATIKQSRGTQSKAF